MALYLFLGYEARVRPRYPTFLPLRADPEALQALVERYVADVLPGRDADASRRWQAVEPALRAAEMRPTWRREAAGRLHAVHPPVQTIPTFIRPAFVPSGVFIDADWSAAHPTIAAVRSGDQNLARDLASSGYYESLAGELHAVVRAFPWAENTEPPDFRSAVKRAVCSYVNGGSRAIAKYAGEAIRRKNTTRGWSGLPEDVLLDLREISQWFYLTWWSRYPTLQAWGTSIAQSWQPDICEVRTLTGRSLLVPVDNWRSLLSAQWSSVEAEAMDFFLFDSPYRESVVLPMFDGVLLDVQHPYPASVKEWMTWAMASAGVPEIGVKVVVQKRWGVPVDAP